MSGGDWVRRRGRDGLLRRREDRSWRRGVHKEKFAKKVLLFYQFFYGGDRRDFSVIMDKTLLLRRKLVRTCIIRHFSIRV